VVIIQENRSVDNLFNGFTGANTVSSGLDSHGRQITLKPQDLDSEWDVDHTHHAFSTEYDGGKLDGFDEVRVQNAGGQKYPGKDFAYAYVPQSETTPYWTMASQYVLSDNTFQSNNGPSFPAHLFLIAGQSGNVVDNANKTPWGCDAPNDARVPLINPDTGQLIKPGVFPCFDKKTISVTLADELDAAGLSWRYYAPAIGSDYGQNWSVYDSIKWIRFGADWQSDVISPETQILTDVQNGNLANVTWVVPSASNSDHGGIDSLNGPSWVASVVNAVGQSKFWKSTAIFVMWDDWGGWYDHVAPPQYGYEGNGFRVPLIAVSPYALAGVVTHTEHEGASVLKFIENRFGLAQMSSADTRASDLTDMFDFNQQPRQFQVIPQTVPTERVVRAALADHRNPDDDR